MGVVPCAVLATLVVTGCGGPSAAPARPSGHPASARLTSAAPSTVNGSGPQQWIQQFCGKTQEDAEEYLSAMRGAFSMTASQTTVQDLESTKQTIYSGVSSGLDASMTAAADQLTATTAKDPADAAARTFLLGTYQRLHQALATAEDRIQALPTTNVDQFEAMAPGVVDTVLSAVQDSKNAITSNGTLGPVYTADPDCR